MKNTSSGPTYKSLSSDIKAGRIGGIYVLYGEEPYLVKAIIGQLKERIVPPGAEAFAYQRLEGSGLTADALSDALETLPAMSERRLVIIADFELMKPPAGIKPLLEGLINDPPEHLCVVFKYEASQFKPDARTSIYKSLQKAAIIAEFPKQSPAELRRWLIKRFTAEDRVLSPGLADYILFLCGGSMTRLAMECGKIASASGQEVTKEAVDSVAVPTAEAAVFELSDALAARDAAKALDIMSKLDARREEPVFIIAVIGRQIRQMYSAKLALSESKDERFLTKLWGMPGFAATRLIRAVRNVSLGWCRDAVIKCAEADLKMKSTGADRRRILDILLIELCRNG